MPTSAAAREAWPRVPTATSSTPTVAPRRLALVLPSGDRASIDEGTTIGQSAENRIVLDDACVSRRHCVIERLADRLRVRDLGSKNGTYVNEVRVADAPLQPGTLLRVGGCRMRVVEQSRDRSPLCGGSSAMREVRRRVAVLAPTGLPVLIVGETGTGKELVARALHDESGLGGSFVALNCGAIAAELVESELFGHERGAFTGATQRRLGVFQEADGGTLFLDEIGELPLGLQPRLLRALEVGAVRPVGATREQRVKVRVVAATHVDLEQAVREGRFREDLYYRLCGDLLRTPTLRERPGDIAELAERLLHDDGASAVLDEGALEALLAYPWPGNVRELRNVLRRAAVLGGGVLRAGDLELRAVAPPRAAGEVLRLGRPFLELEREILADAIQRSGGNKRAAAHALQIPKSTLCDKAKRYGLG